MPGSGLKVCVVVVVGVKAKFSVQLWSQAEQQDLGLKCSAWKVFGSNDFGLVGLYNKTKLDLFASKKIRI